jgi:hypothetical protein
MSTSEPSKPVCQSFGMPRLKRSDFGSLAGGSRCGMPASQARTVTAETIPGLRRWR